jgi:arylsulfatase A-like enzyme
MKHFRDSHLLKTAGGALSLLQLANIQAATTVTADNKPNIILIYCDDLDFDEVSFYNSRNVPSYNGMKEAGLYKPDKDDKGPSHFQNSIFMPEGETVLYNDTRMYMPVIDKLSSQGAIFNRFYVTSAISTPSRYGMITGRYASKSQGVLNAASPGNVQWNSPIRPGEGTFAKEMKRLGYNTGFVGKWHNGFQTDKEISQAAKSLIDKDPEDPETKKIYQGLYNRSVQYLKDNMGFDYVERVYTNNKEALPLPRSMRVHNLEWITEGALEFIKKDRNNPFFLYMAITLPHGRYSKDLYKDNPLYTPAGVLKERPGGMPDREFIMKTLDEKGIDQRNATATLIDYSVAAIVDALKEKGVDNNTVLIFTSDHQARGKNTCYESCRVPMFIWWGKRIKPGTKIDEICANIDITSTIVDMAGGTVSKDNPQDGKSFLPWLLGKEKKDFRKALLLECGFSRAAVTKEYKYLVNRPPANIEKVMNDEAEKCLANNTRRRIGWDGVPSPHIGEPGIRYYADRDFPCYFDKDQVYNLKNDFFEQNNILNIAEGQKILPEMKEIMKELLKDMNYPFGEFK